MTEQAEIQQVTVTRDSINKDADTDGARLQQPKITA